VDAVCRWRSAELTSNSHSRSHSCSHRKQRPRDMRTWLTGLRLMRTGLRDNAMHIESKDLWLWLDVIITWVEDEEQHTNTKQRSSFLYVWVLTNVSRQMWHLAQRMDVGWTIPRQCTVIRHPEWTCFSIRAVSASDGAAPTCSRTVTCCNAALCAGTYCCQVFPTWTSTPHAAGSFHHLQVQHTNITFSFHIALESYQAMIWHGVLSVSRNPPSGTLCLLN